jgi:hypothetical protein
MVCRVLAGTAPLLFSNAIFTVFDHFAGTQAAGANISGCGMAVFDDPQLANVGHPAPLVRL